MKTFTFLCFLFSSFNLFGQYQSNNFETNDNLDILFDTTNITTIWQIGPPQKTIFNMATSEPNVIVTDTINYYPVGQETWFEVELSSFSMSSFPLVQLEWFQQTDMEENVDGGIIEASYDGGLTWKNVLDDPDFQPEMVGSYQTGTLHNGKTGVTGTQGESWMAICWGNWFGTFPPVTENVKVRFNFVSDSIDTQQEGWLIDNFYVMTEIIGSATNVVNAQAIPIYPNPVKEALRLDLKNINTVDAQISIFNAAGQKVYEENLDGNLESIKIPLKGIHKGIHYLSIQTQQDFYSQSFVKM